MDTIDQAKAARVWQRVRGDAAPASDTGGLPELIANEWTDGTTYLMLSRHFQGKAAQTLQKMYTQEQAHTACLKGIYTLITGRPPQVRAPAPKITDPEQTLRRCYGREMQCLAQYEQRRDDPEYGQVFARLADQEREHCRMILELIGSLKKK